MLSPMTREWAMSTPSRSAAARNRSGSGLAYRTWSRVITGTRCGSTPSVAMFGAAVSMRPLVAIAQGMPSALRWASSSRAPGRGRIAPLSARRL